MNAEKQPAVAGPVEPTVRQRADGGAAFPVLPPQDTAAGIATGYPYPEAGMTLRDYFAAKALPGVLYMVAHGAHDAASSAEGCALEAYKLADAMLAVRAA